MGHFMSDLQSAKTEKINHTPSARSKATLTLLLLIADTEFFDTFTTFQFWPIFERQKFLCDALFFRRICAFDHFFNQIGDTLLLGRTPYNDFGENGQELVNFFVAQNT